MLFWGSLFMAIQLLLHHQYVPTCTCTFSKLYYYYCIISKSLRLLYVRIYMFKVLRPLCKIKCCDMHELRIYFVHCSLLHMYVRMYVCMYVHVCMYICMYVCIICMYVCMYVHNCSMHYYSIVVKTMQCYDIVHEQLHSQEIYT